MKSSQVNHKLFKWKKNNVRGWGCDTCIFGWLGARVMLQWMLRGLCCAWNVDKRRISFVFVFNLWKKNREKQQWSAMLRLDKYLSFSGVLTWKCHSDCKWFHQNWYTHTEQHPLAKRKIFFLLDTREIAHVLHVCSWNFIDRDFSAFKSRVKPNLFFVWAVWPPLFTHTLSALLVETVFACDCVPWAIVRKIMQTTLN